MGEEFFEVAVVVVSAVDAVLLAVDGMEDPVVVVTGGARVLVAPVVASVSEVVAAPEFLGAALWGCSPGRRTSGRASRRWLAAVVASLTGARNGLVERERRRRRGSG